MSSGITIRRAATGDIDAIAAIQSESPGAASWDPNSYLDHDCLVAKLDGQAVGFLVTRPTGPGETEILNLAVAPAWRRRGVARALLDGVLRKASGEIFLEVRESNTAARQLYRAVGFQEIGVRRDYYDEPSEAAIVMRL